MAQPSKHGRNLDGSLNRDFIDCAMDMLDREKPRSIWDVAELMIPYGWSPTIGEMQDVLGFLVHAGVAVVYSDITGTSIYARK